MVYLPIKLEDYAIYFDEVTYEKKGEKIINGVTGGFRKSKITAIVGPSGAGKTSVLMLCNGLKHASSGNIYINGKLIDTFQPQTLRRTVGLAFQDAKMIVGTARKNLALPLTLQQKQLTTQIGEQLLKVVGLEPQLLKMNVRELSGGERQRLALARTLVNQPDILLLDEITASLDQLAAKEIEQLILSINKKNGTTIIWITHDLEQAKRVANYVWIMMNGQLYESGAISVLQHPKHDAVKQFVQGELQ